MNFKEYLNRGTVYLDGGMGTLLQAAGLLPGEMPEGWCITHADTVTAIHKAYIDSGARVISTNTFGANILKLDECELDRVIAAAVACAKSAIAQSLTCEPVFVALDIGPTGKLLAPLGEVDFEDAVEIFAKTVRLGVKYGVDLIFIETMSDSYEAKAALLAAKENSTLPVIVSCAYGADGKLMTGATPSAMVAMLEGMGADAIGANCSLGPKMLRPDIEELLACASVPVVLKPNAGLPRVVDGKAVYDVAPKDFAREVAELVKCGVRLVGGCCGTSPEYIKELALATRDIAPLPIKQKNITAVSSYTHSVVIGKEPVLIGERINPTGKRRFKEALVENDMNYILEEGVNQEKCGVHILDVNVGLPEIDEKDMLTRAVCELQAVTDLPLQIDTANIAAMESALRRYNGKAMINSVSGKAESMAKIFPLVKKYGGVVVALTLDEGGIPKDALGRVEIARKILKTAEKYGIDKKDIVFDTLAMAVSAEHDAARATLGALRIIKEELGCNTSLGVSNVSFGLPCRGALNAAFFTLALGCGLSCAIMNPYSADMMRTYYSYRALMGLDTSFDDYIKHAAVYEKEGAPQLSVQNSTAQIEAQGLRYAIIKGFKDKAAELTHMLLSQRAPLDIVNSEIIPALNSVGLGYEEKTVYLPQLLMSAEAAKSAFEVIKSASVRGTPGTADAPVILATVKGDIHDIGKNIVKLLLENYGFYVEDLGRDVPPEVIVERAISSHAPIVGLSALMTTTVPAMEETVRLLHVRAPWCKAIVGGAVLTEEYAKQIGADKYAKDAMEAVRYAEEIIKSKT